MKTIRIDDKNHAQLMRLKIRCKAKELNDIITILIKSLREYNRWKRQQQ